MAEPLIAFAGTVSCTPRTGAPGLTLAGVSARHPQQPVQLAFSSPAPAGLPAALEDVVVEALPLGGYRVTSGARSWSLGPGAVHLHRDVGAAFYRALPPRPAPWRRRLLWGTALRLAGNRAGLALLRALRG
jgi:hypothetical protein